MVKSQSAKQRKRTRLLSERKRARLAREIDARGFAMCEGGCGRVFADLELAMAGLAGHHAKHRGMGASYNREGIDDDENIRLLCSTCHRREHS